MSNSLPVALLNALDRVKDFDRGSFEAVHTSGSQVTSVRVNPQKITNNSAFSFKEYIAGTVPWCPNGVYLSERPSFTFDPQWHGGAYYVQEASSMFLWHVLETCIGTTGKAMRVLDLCAAPGGKSTLLASYFNEGLVVSNEVIKARAAVLAENLTKWGSANTVVTNNDPQQFSRVENYFDVIVTDAPCSGSGLFRKDPDAISEWSEASVMLCSRRQQRIIADVYDALKPGGLFIYSTCSYSEEEDEMIAAWFCDQYHAENIRVPLQNDWGVVETVTNEKVFGYRFFPDKVKGEGFFISVFRKEVYDHKPLRMPSLTAAAKNEIAHATAWLKNAGEHFYFKQADNIVAVPHQWQQDIALLQKNLYLRKAGVTIGAVKGRSLVPHHELALSCLTGNDIPSVELSKEEAINYLKKRDIAPATAVKGWSLVICFGINIGWIKVLHNRVNNYYPTEWRILKD